MEQRAPSISKIAAVVVLYHPEGDLLSRLRAVTSQVGLLIIVSNDRLGSARLADLPANHIVYIENSDNSGLAAALNQGLKRAKELSFDWCLLLDQDTCVDGDLVEGLLHTYNSYPRPSIIAILAPNYRSQGGKRIAYPHAVAYQEMRTVVTSGSLVRLAVIDVCGGMKEEFFIEGIDLEFALRVRRAGWKVIASGKPLMTHGAGADEERRFLWRTVQVGHHSPERYYLQFRNLTCIIMKYFFYDLTWTANSCVAVIKKTLIVFAFERGKWAKLKSIYRGFGDGLLGRLSTNPLVGPWV